MFCPKCGNEIGNDEMYCSSCGRKRTENVEVIPRQPEKPVSNTQHYKIAGGIAVAVLLLFVAFKLVSGPKIYGTYVGEVDNGTLVFTKTGKWSLFEEHWIENLSLSGTYKKDGKVYVLDCDGVELYAEMRDDNSLYIYSNDSHWASETFRRVSDDTELKTEDTDDEYDE
ncbi:MAG: zinc-ribbon domain-containing protein [Lachnospiraceae bacterium]